MLQWMVRNKNYKLPFLRVAILAVVFCSFFSFSAPASAQQGVGNDIVQGTQIIQPSLGLASSDIRIIIARIIRVALGLLGTVFLVLVMYGGFLWMTAGGNESRIDTAKKIIINGVIGIAIILSAYAIVTFILNKLLDAVNGTGDDGMSAGGVGSYSDASFFGSGALGKVIKDHYPTRDQVDVPRNTKIIITFRNAVDPASFVNDTNGNGTYGDCVRMGDPSFKWENDCDQLKLDDSHILIKKADSSEAIRGASVVASVENGKIFTVVIRPYDALGSDSAKVQYKVHVGAGIVQSDAAIGKPSIFEGRPSGRDFYEWNFTCSTALDTSPPHVTSVFPGGGGSESRNSVIQINFSKPMDPTGLQGNFSTGNGYYTLKGDVIFLKSNHSSMPAGTFRILNNYQTLEFTPSAQCGQNSCGSPVYCLPVCDSSGAGCSEDSYEVMIRAAQTFNNSSFEAVPFSGAMDMSGNALDGNNNGSVNAVARTGAIFPDQEKADNYFWKFNLKNNIDSASPYLIQVQPGPEATYVAANEPWKMVFSKRMRVDSLYNISIDQTPSGEELCRVPRASFLDNGYSNVDISHCPFLTDVRHYYFPVVDSSVQDVHFNCYYPGQGPVGLEGQTHVSQICDDAHPENCCLSGNAQDNSICCNGLPNASDQQQCLNNLKASSH